MIIWVGLKNPLMASPCDPGQHVLRRLEPRDIPQVKILCNDCFPIQYSEQWFQYVTSTKVYSMGCFLTERGRDYQLISMVIGEEQPLKQVEDEVGPILASALSCTTVMYVISLGVLSQHRKRGLGSLLINSLLAYVSSQSSCLAVYLHVQASNSAAQSLYNQLGFREFTVVPKYYFIAGQFEDAYLYCCYVNGGTPFPHTLRGYVHRYYESITQCLTNTCSTVTTLLKKLVNLNFHRTFRS